MIPPTREDIHSLLTAALPRMTSPMAIELVAGYLVTGKIGSVDPAFNLTMDQALDEWAWDVAYHATFADFSDRVGLGSYHKYSLIQSFHSLQQSLLHSKP